MLKHAHKHIFNGYYMKKRIKMKKNSKNGNITTYKNMWRSENSDGREEIYMEGLIEIIQKTNVKILL